ncbi:MFS transporter [Paenibacillus antri]|uniref:MFS transporter n=1 Tax=Paenibacillus antri TaxID=2582848 RepID=A0A5R9GKS8_9BACL|nr:MFS transporter [Paenibacillus antri]TLS52345.1 MFS transporter [Paenibacillus antri]
MSTSTSSTYRKVFWSAGFGWMFDAMDVGLLSFILVMLKEEWRLTPSEGGLLGTMNMVGMAMGAFLGGYYADRIGRRPVFLYTLALFGLASVGSAAATGFLSMLVLRFLMGLGLGAELPVASTLVNEFAPEAKRGRAVVLLESFWAFGWILAAVIAYFVMPAYGWRTAVLIGAFPLLYAVAIRRNIPESPAFVRRDDDRVTVRDIFTVYRKPTIALWSVWLAISFSYYGMFLWLPSVLVDKGYTLIKSFEYVLLMTLAQLPGYFSAAYLVERWGRKPTLAAFMAMTAVAAVGFGASESDGYLLLYGALLSFFNLGAWGALYAYTPENYPARVRASGAGFASAFGRVGSIVAPFLVGAFIDNQVGYLVIFGMFTVVLLIGAFLLMFLGTETRPLR